MERGISIGILVALILILVIYVIILFEMYKGKWGIFAPYVAPNLPNSFHPLGGVVQLTPQERYQRCVNYLGISDPICEAMPH